MTSANSKIEWSITINNDKIESRNANKEVVNLLKSNIRILLFLIEWITYTKDKDPFEFFQSLYIAIKTKF